jgi:hypothetical protein
MKKTYFLMLLALVFLVFSCRYVFDEQLNSLLTNPTFLYGDYITSPNHELLLQAVRAWIPNHVTDINGDLSDLNQRIEHFVNNDELFANLVTYNQNTQNVPNAEAADYSIRVYELIKWLLDNPSPQNGQLAAWGVSFFDQNRFVSWEQFKNTYILNTGFVTYINSLPLNLNQIITSQPNQDFFYGLNSYYIRNQEVRRRKILSIGHCNLKQIILQLRGSSLRNGLQKNQ